MRHRLKNAHTFPLLVFSFAGVFFSDGTTVSADTDDITAAVYPKYTLFPGLADVSGHPRGPGSFYKEEKLCRK